MFEWKYKTNFNVTYYNFCYIYDKLQCNIEMKLSIIRKLFQYCYTKEPRKRHHKIDFDCVISKYGKYMVIKKLINNCI